MGILNSTRIKLLKRKARKLKLEINEIYDDESHGGGKSVVQMLNPYVVNLEKQFKETIEKLRELDPNCPK